MKKAVMAAVLLALSVETALFAATCREYEAAYSTAQFRSSEMQKVSYRERYDMANTLIDAAIDFLAYCKDEINLDKQYRIMQVIRQEDIKRRRYFKGAVREYHAIYGIRPDVTEIYQDGSSSGNGGGAPSPSSPPRFPPVRQPMMPPVKN